MKKKTLWTPILITLPVLASGFTGMPNAVRVWDPNLEVSVYYSYFDMIPQTTFPYATPVAAVAACAAAVLAIVYGVTKKLYTLNGVLITSILGAVAALLPIVVAGDFQVVPNVAVPILLAVESLMAVVMKKNYDPAEETKARAPRLR